MIRIDTCGELLDYLQKQPRDRRIILAKDAEENGYSPIADAMEGWYEAESTWSGDVYEDGDRPEGAERVVVLGPVN